MREMTEQQIEDVHEIRAGLETVALNHAMDKATEEQIHDLHHHLEEMFEAAKDGDEKFFMESDIKFHEAIVDMADTTDLKNYGICVTSGYGRRYVRNVPKRNYRHWLNSMYHL